MIERRSPNVQGMDQTAWLGSFVADFIAEQRDCFISTCRPLRAQHFERMSVHFSPDDLERVRFRNIYPERVPNPAFYAGLQCVGFHRLPDFGARKAVTFDQVIVTHEPFTPAFLFRELVYTVQYRLLGIEGFARAYVQALLAGDRYGDTPLERCAQALEERFVSGSYRIDVEGEIREWLVADNTHQMPQDTLDGSRFGSYVSTKWAGLAALLRPTSGANRSASMQ